VIGNPPLSLAESTELQRLLQGRRPVHGDERLELAFRRWQACWRRRLAAAERLSPIDDGGTVDSLAPNGRRWAA